MGTSRALSFYAREALTRQNGRKKGAAEAAPDGILGKDV
jgi:hypothetical protein